MQYRTRFAPSPSGLLHVGNAYSALYCARWAEQHQAELLLRIEDIDHTRCRAEFAEHIITDLHWLGLHWPQPVRYQSRCLAAYQEALLELQHMAVVYPCFCTRKDIQQEINRMPSAPQAENSAPIYPGTCRNLDFNQQQQRMKHEPYAWRLDVQKALTKTGENLSWQDGAEKRHPAQIDHDIVIGRKDIGFSYHLSVVVDDAEQHISHIIRGEDLRDSTGIHRLLQELLQKPEPVYIHHALLCEANGSKLSKRDGSVSLQSLRLMGVEAQKLHAFLNHSTPLSWPFSQARAADILDILGN